MFVVYVSVLKDASGYYLAKRACSYFLYSKLETMISSVIVSKSPIDHRVFKADEDRW